MVYSHPSIEKMYYSTETASGWSNSEILSNANLSSAPSLWFDGADMHILYRDSSLDRLERVTKSGGTWSTATELGSGEAVGIEHVALQVPSGPTLVATTVNNSSVHELQILDIDNDVSTPLTNFSDGASQLAMCIDTSNTVVLLSLDSSGVLVMHERNATTGAWSNVSMQQLSPSTANDLSCTQHGSSFSLQFNPQQMPCTNETVLVIGPLLVANRCRRLVEHGVSHRMDQVSS